MVEVLITNIEKISKAKRMVKLLEKEFDQLKIDYDMNETKLAYPCGHTILRIEGRHIYTKEIISTIEREGILCELIKDEICR
ncbi:hypothetical protein Q4603_09020 [Zobellia galactanivorans]|uniref:Uncharacterized protein n=1 Tax=Zobellia galactanivorans (strain DSM 12802 / CCUG 47099 / CIP 106680 / NCIMB 13871 / Dsij) TaxID=63186 RepID=G0L333_ZOBGA|nr:MULTISPECIES: hypothetical protein [Zobellia]MBU3024951.1 hypothetical protein [Zobellia galactanivorans]MDO6808751.1 hypothetical protein [Zobellia galactanivorans]OWW25726.1 hypothetical protein B4Q04_08985 [Zobellia sp. OII3]CAZ98357.1 Conserved hypothetical protein [Zobellia galactanivorans]